MDPFVNNRCTSLFVLTLFVIAIIAGCNGSEKIGSQSDWYFESDYYKLSCGHYDIYLVNNQIFVAALVGISNRKGKKYNMYYPEFKSGYLHHPKQFVLYRIAIDSLDYNQIVDILEYEILDGSWEECIREKMLYTGPCLFIQIEKINAGSIHAVSRKVKCLDESHIKLIRVFDELGISICGSYYEPPPCDSIDHSE